LIVSLLSAQARNDNASLKDSEKWNTRGFKQANSMGAGEAAIPKRGRLRVFLLMGQSNTTGSRMARELKSPYNQNQERIRG